MTQIRKCTINLSFIQNVCFIVVSWPIAALNKYITYLGLAFRLGAGFVLRAKYSCYFQEQIMQISFLPNSLATSYIEHRNRGWC